MQSTGTATPGQQRALVLLSVVLLLGMLVGIAGMAMWMAAAWPGGWGFDHMNRMMGGGGRDSSRDTAVQGSVVETISIEDFAYSPGNLEVPVGANVTWINRDSAPHSATDRDGSWDTGLLAQGERATLVFDAPGTFAYYCTVHPTMKAQLVVR